MPWLLFFFLGGAAVLASSPKGASRGSEKKPGRYGLTFTTSERDKFTALVGSIPRANESLPNKMLAPYRLEDARRLGDFVGASCVRQSQNPLAQKIWSDLGHPEIVERLAAIGQSWQRLQVMSWADEAQAVAAWVDLVIAPSFVHYCWSTWLPTSVPGFAMAGCACKDANGVLVMPANREGAKAIPGCMCQRQDEMLAAIASWLTGYYTSPGQALVQSDGATIAWGFLSNFGGVAPASPWILIGKSKSEKLYASSGVKFASVLESQRLMLELANRVMAIYDVYTLVDKTNVPPGSILLGNIPGVLASLYQENKPENAVTIAGWSNELLVRSQFLANVAFSQQVVASDPVRWVSKGFGLFVEIWVTAATALGLGPLAQVFANASSAILGAASSTVGITLPAGATTLVTFAVKTAVNALIIEGINLSPLGGILPGLSKQQVIDDAKKSVETVLGTVKTKVEGKVGSAMGVVKGFA